MIRTSGVVVLVTLAGCTTPTTSITAERAEPHQVLVTVKTAPTSHTATPAPAHRASRSRHGLPTILLRIRSCESGPNGYATHGYAFDADYTATNPNSTASGAFQFLNGTWRSTTGLPGRAKDYPPSVQDAAALRLYAEQGTRPWNASRACWGS